jgi:hypothetical protein
MKLSLRDVSDQRQRRAGGQALTLRHGKLAVSCGGVMLCACDFGGLAQVPDPKLYHL